MRSLPLFTEADTGALPSEAGNAAKERHAGKLALAVARDVGIVPAEATDRDAARALIAALAHYTR
jgi:hypothetical protein